MKWSNGLLVFGHIVIQILCPGEGHIREEFMEAVGLPISDLPYLNGSYHTT